MNTYPDAHTLQQMVAIFAGHREINEVVMYSNTVATGEGAGGELCVTLVGSAITEGLAKRVWQELQELQVPCLFHLTAHQELDCEFLLRRIAETGSTLYRRETLA